MNLSEELKKIKKQENLKFRELKEICKCPLNNIYNWYYGKNEPSFYKLQELLNSLGYEIKFIKKEDKNDSRRN